MSNGGKIPFATILAKLNDLLGLKSSSDLVKQLLSPNIPPQEQVSSEPLDDLVNSILSMQNSGKTFDELKKSIDDFIDSAPNDPLAKSFSSQAEDKSAPIWITHWSEPGTDSDPDYQRKASISNVMAIDEDAVAKMSPIHVVEMADLNLNFSNRDASTVAAFLKVLPSIEISKAVPYFDCKVITMSKVAEGQEIDSATMFNNGISIHRFLDGDITDQETIESSIILAKFAPGQIVEKEQLNNMSGGKTTQILSNAGMELFTSPQTMVNGNARFYDLDTSSTGAKGVSPTGRSIMDPFRPLMTFESFSLSVTPHTGMVTTKAADVKLKLHDRSRMSEIAPLISPSRIGDIELHIEWGWSHPESNPENNIFGALINQMKVKERYGVANSSYTFTPDGQVDITLKLYTKGAQNIAFDLVRGASADHPIDTLNSAVLETRKAVSQLRGEGFSLKNDLSAPDFLGKASSAKGILSLDDEQITKLKEFVKRLKKGRSPESFKVLADSLEKLSTQAGDFKESIEAGIDKKIEKMNNSSGENPDPWLVPKPETTVNKKIAVPEINVASHVSLCKFLLHFVAEPISSTKKFNEVQLVFYPMNDLAMYARDYTTAQYPLNKKILDSVLAEELKKTPTLRIQTLLNIVQKIFINNPGDDIYGMSSFFPYSKDAGKRQLIKSYKEDPDKKQQLAIQKQEVMLDCYGDGATTIRKFKKPNLTMFVESCPVDKGNGSILRLHFIDKNATSYSTYEQLWQSTSQSSLGVIGQFASAMKKQKLLSKKKNFSKKEKDRMKKHAELVKEHDKKVASMADQHSAKLNELVEKGLLEQIGTTGKYKIKGGPQQIRGIMAANMPTLKYGTEYSGILAASLATQSNAQMETIHMQRSKRDKSQPLDSGSDGVPLRTRPAQLSLSVFGCPLINFGQQFFVDFNTNSTIDDIYTVVGISHSISTSEFKTDIKMVPLQKFGQYSSLVDSLSDIQDIADEAKTEVDKN